MPSTFPWPNFTCSGADGETDDFVGCADTADAPQLPLLREVVRCQVRRGL